jgi:hypothetical protein
MSDFEQPVGIFLPETTPNPKSPSAVGASGVGGGGEGESSVQVHVWHCIEQDRITQRGRLFGREE